MDDDDGALHEEEDDELPPPPPRLEGSRSAGVGRSSAAGGAVSPRGGDPGGRPAATAAPLNLKLKPRQTVTLGELRAGLGSGCVTVDIGFPGVFYVEVSQELTCGLDNLNTYTL